MNNNDLNDLNDILIEALQPIKQSLIDKVTGTIRDGLIEKMTPKAPAGANVPAVAGVITDYLVDRKECGDVLEEKLTKNDMARRTVLRAARAVAIISEYYQLNPAYEITYIGDDFVTACVLHGHDYDDNVYLLMRAADVYNLRHLTLDTLRTYVHNGRKDLW